MDVSSTRIPEGLRAGRLEGIGFPELLIELCRTGTTGVLCVAQRDVKKNVYIERGRVTFAASENPDDRLGILLLQQNAITLHELETAVRKASAGKRLGTLLVEADSITPEHLVEAVFDQVKGIVLDLFTVTEAEYRFMEGPLPTREVITLDLPTNALVVAGIKRVRSLGRIRLHVGGPTTVWSLSEHWEDALYGLTLGEGERLLVERLAQSEASLDDLCSEVFLSNFEIYQLLWALKVLGAVEELGFRADLPDELPYREARGEQSFLEFLMQLCRAKETGVLYATLGSRERSFHLRQGECVFATSNDSEDGLVNFLLRRGVISLRDRDEVRNRLLSNKRVGTILLELGVIDDVDLHDMVRQQLIEVVYDTFRWVGGEFSFVSGPLPSIEPITLDQGLESLVVAGLRRVTSWSRIRRGCGGLRSILALTPEYLDVLDAMHGGVEEWEIVNALRTPRSPLEVCQLSHLSNFRVCQILWAMKILGGIEVIQTEQPEAWEQPDARIFADFGEFAEQATPEEPASTEPALQETELGGAGVIDEDLERDAEVHPAGAPQDSTPVQWAQEPQPEEMAASEGPEDQAIVVKVAEESDLEGVSAPEADFAEPGASTEPAEPEERKHPRVARAPEEGAEAPTGEEDDSQSEPGGGWTAGSVTPPVRAPQSAWPRVDAPDDEAVSAAPPEIQDEEPWEDRFQEQTERASEDDLPSTADLETSNRAAPKSPEQAEAAVRGETPEAELEESETPEEHEAPSDTPVPVPEIEIEVMTEAPDIEDGGAVVEGPTWYPPDDLDASIARFNALQRVIYRTVRSEVGAGAANFIRSCCDGGPQAGAVTGTELHTDGSWDPEGLRTAVIEHRIEDPWFEYRQLISREIDILRVHIGEARAHELRLHIERVTEELNP